MTETVLVSACLLGFPCRHDGRAKTSPEVLKVVSDHEVVPICPEAASGLGIPRKAFAFSADREHLLSEDGTDGTEAFERGARIAEEAARRWGATRAILKARSPSCGSHAVYVRDSEGTETLQAGSGVTAARLSRAGLAILTEEELE